MQAQHLVVHCRWSRSSRGLTCECDAGFAGRCVSRKSTSGLYASGGTSFLKFFSNTQTTIATSTRESEFYSTLSCVATGIGIEQLLADFGIVADLHAYSVASAGISLCKRQGLPRARHIAAQFLWAQAVFKQSAHRLQQERSWYEVPRSGAHKTFAAPYWAEFRSVTRSMSRENTVSVLSKQTCVCGCV